MSATLDEVLAAQAGDDDALQALIDSGAAWRLEGSVGRAAMRAIEDGRCILGPVGHRDYWGNYVPARDEVVPGTKGSVEYARERAAGQGLAEYALILGLIAIVAIIALIFIGGQVSATMSNVGNSL